MDETITVFGITFTIGQACAILGGACVVGLTAIVAVVVVHMTKRRE